MSFAFKAIYNCCWNMFIRRTIYWIVIPCAKLQKIFGITIKLGNNFGVWRGLRWFEFGLMGFEGGWEKVWILFDRVWGSGLNKNRKNLLVVVPRSFVAHVVALCACECKRASILSPPNHQPPFGLRTTTRTINKKNNIHHRTSEAILFVLWAKWFLSVAMVCRPLGVLTR